jgi:peptidyl-prolyl cis-trans isomerase D
MAMMSWMRRTSRYFLIVVVLTFVGSLAYFGATQERSAQTVVAKVNGAEISATEYDRARRAVVEQYRQAMGARFNEELLKSLRVQDQVLDRLVTDRLMLDRAAAEGIQVSDAELADEITRIPAFHEGGRFNRERYQRVLARLDPPRTPSGFEQEYRAQLLQRKLQTLVADGVKVSEAEARKYWETRQDRVRAGYLQLPIEAFLPAGDPAEADVTTYYEKNSARYTRPERRRVQMALLPTGSVPPPTVTDADVEAAYTERQSQFEQPERRKVSHILTRVAAVGGSEAEDQAKAKAEAALARIKGGADFAQVAREVSEDATTGAKGGELGQVKKGEMVAPFEQLAFSLKVGEVGGPVRTAFGYHLIKVQEILPASKQELKEVAASLRAVLVTEGQLKALRDKADEAGQALLRAPDFAAEARRRGLTLREIGPLARTDSVEGIGRVAEATGAIFNLPDGGVSAPVKVPEGYAVFRLIETQKATVPPLAEVRAQVVQALKREKAGEAAQAKARQIIEALKAGQDPKAVAKRESATYAEVGPFSRIQPLSDAKLMPVLGSALTLPEGGVGGPSQDPGSVYVVKVLAREHPDAAEFAKARPELEKQLLEQKKGQAWQAWIANLCDGARRTNSVELNRTVLPDVGSVCGYGKPTASS